MQTYDIAILGGGIAGLSLAYFLGASRSVVVLEREENLGYHSTGRSAAEFVLRYNSPEVCALAAISRDFFDHPPQGFAEVQLLVPRGGMMIANAEKLGRFEAHFAAERTQADNLTRLSIDEALAMVPILDPAYIAGAYHDPEFWDIEVESLLQGYVKGARRAGTGIRTGAGVTAIRDDGRQWHIETRDGPVAARTIVNASGGWADATAGLAGLGPLGIVPHRRTAVLLDLPGFDPSGMPEVNELDEEFYFKPDAGRLLVSPADETPCEAADVQPEDIDIAWAVHHVETATTIKVTRVARSWAGMRSFTRDRLPAIGFDPGHPRFFWLAGQGGYGILSSPALGALAATLLVDAETPDGFREQSLDPDLFSPHRF